MKKPESIIFIYSILILASCNLDVTKKSQHSLDEYLISYNVFAPDSINEDNYEIFVMQIDGSNKENITNNSDVAWTYLAFDETLFFISDRDSTNRSFFLYEMNARGKGIRKITDFRLRDSWMGVRNNGKELIVNPHPSVDSAFYIIDRDGNILNRIYTGLKSSSDPAFSPDGKKVAFRGANKRSKREENYEEEIYLINADASGLKQLTQYPQSDTTAPWYAYKAGPPKWHPTEDIITFQSYRNNKYSLYAVQSDGSRIWKLTENEQEEGWHSWSPDGKWLAVELFDQEQTQFHIGLMNWETKDLEILTDTTYQYQQAPVFVR